MVKIITLAANKGGVGKTALSLELAYILGAVLVDLDWDAGGATRAWGYDPDHDAPLFRALEAPLSTVAPTPRKAPGRPRLIPSSPLLADIGVTTAEEVAAKLVSWSEAWNTDYVVVDTHPGAATLSYGAMAAAHVVIVPIILATRELDALQAMLVEFAEFPLLLIPNRVPRWPDAAAINRLDQMATAASVTVGPAVSDHRWWPRRRRRTVLTATARPGVQAAAAIAELQAVAHAVQDVLRERST